MMEWVALSAGRCGSEYVEYSRKIQNEELIDNRFKDLITFGADSYE